MKKLTALLLAMTMLLGLLAGCAAPETPEPIPPSEPTPSEPIPAPPVTPDPKPDPAPARPEELTLYLGGGSDSNDGLTPEKPLATLEKAAALLKEQNPTSMGTICLVGEVKVPADCKLPDHAYTLEIYAKDSAGKLVLGGNFFMGGDTVFHDMEFVTTVDGLRYIVANCHKLTIGENVIDTPHTASDGSKSYMNLVGGGYNANITGDSCLTVMSGEWRNIYGASYNGSKNKDKVQTGSSLMTFTGGTVYGVLTGGMFYGTLTGDVVCNVTGGAVLADADTEGLYGAAVYGTTNGNVTLNVLSDSADKILLPGKLAGGTRQNTGVIKGDITVNLQGATLGGSYVPLGKAVCHGTVTTNLTGPAAINSALTVDSFSGGDLLMGPDGRLTVTGSVSGTGTVTLTDPVNGQIFAEAPEATGDDAFSVTTAGVGYAVTVENGVKRWTVTEGGGASRSIDLTIRVPQEAEKFMTFSWWYNKSGYSMSAASVSQPADGYITYTYSDVKAGIYATRITAPGCYNVCTAFYITEDDIAAGAKTMTVELVKASGDGYEPKTGNSANVQRHILPGLAALLTTGDLTMDGKTPFEEIKTPAFAESKNDHQYTTEAEMLALLDALQSQNSRMHVFELGKSTMGKTMPLVLFTKADIPANATLEQAAAVIRDSGRATVQITGSIHGNEPSGAEAALLMMQALCGQYDSSYDWASVLDKVNVYFIPRTNPDGLETHVRKNPTTDYDMNRDWISSFNQEIRNVHTAYNSFLPHVTIDMHEFAGDMTLSSSDEIAYDNGTPYLKHFDDIRITGSSSLNSSAAVNAGILDMVDKAFAELQVCGLRVHDYGNTKAHVLNHAYHGLQGSYAFLLEARGIALIKSDNYGRRVFSQFAAVRSLLDYTVQHADAMYKNVTDFRAETVEKGKTYEAGDPLAIYTTKSGELNRTVARPSFNLDGSYRDKDRTETFGIYDTISISRTAPTAYLLPVSASADKIKAALESCGAQVWTLPAGTKLPVQQYVKSNGGQTACDLTQETEVTFAEGAYIVTMDQTCAKVIGMLLEIDNMDTSTDYTLMALGLMEADSTGAYPVYRYIRDNPRTTLELK